MKISVILLLLSTVKASVVRYNEDLPEGSECAIENSHKNGICRKTSVCRQGLQEYQRNRKNIPVCGFTDKESIICCPKSQSMFQQQRQYVNLDWNYCVEQYLEHRVALPNYVFSMVHGTEVVNGEFANMAAIGCTQRGGFVDYHCGGSVISLRHVLTAAHCTMFNGRKPDVVRLGDFDLKSEEDNEFAQMKKISRIVNHPQYSKFSTYHDIALLELDSDIEFNKRVSPACLYIPKHFNYRLPFHIIEAAGYGSIDFGDRRSDKLEKIGLDVVNIVDCNQIFKNDPQLPYGIIDKQICAKGMTVNDKESDTCSGDSGGPLQTIEYIKRNGYSYHIPVLLGLTSFGIGCASGTPGVYVNTTSYIDFIKLNINYY